MKLALFDLDNTLLEGDSDHGWGEYLASVGLVDREHYRQTNERFYRDYQQGRLDMAEYLAFQLIPLNRYPRELLLRHRANYVDSIIRPKLRPRGLDAIAQHRAQGHQIIMITATNEFITRPIADCCGVEHLIATQIEEQNGQWTGRSQGIPSFGVGKITRLESWLGLQGTSLSECESWFYSDSMNDYPLLSRVNHPIVISPDAKLCECAQNHGWRIEDWSMAQGNI